MPRPPGTLDRKSTRLNSSHVSISYAVFCLNNPSHPDTYPLSLHDALPISRQPAAAAPHFAHAEPQERRAEGQQEIKNAVKQQPADEIAMRQAWHQHHDHGLEYAEAPWHARSEEHTSELQSRFDLVCRLLLEQSVAPRHLPSFPTRRSSDLPAASRGRSALRARRATRAPRRRAAGNKERGKAAARRRDRHAAGLASAPRPRPRICRGPLAR